MSSRVRFEGLEELQEALRTLPAELLLEATTIVQDAAEGAKTKIAAGYPSRATTLRDGLEVNTVSATAMGVVVLLRNKAPESRWFEFGTQVRHTKLGWNRGQMPATPVFFPEFYRARRGQWAALAAMVERHGLTVVNE
jgi:hypothetical protein